MPFRLDIPVARALIQEISDCTPATTSDTAEMPCNLGSTSLVVGRGRDTAVTLSGCSRPERSGPREQCEREQKRCSGDLEGIGR